MKLPTNHSKAMDPRTLVMTICPIAPTLIDINPITRFRGERKKTRPPYSPIRFGVKTAQVSPQNTDSIALQVLIFSTLRSKYFHFKASRNQFKNIKRIKVVITIQTFNVVIDFVSDLKSAIFWLSVSIWTINPKASTNMAILIIMLIYFFAWRFNGLLSAMLTKTFTESKFWTSFDCKLLILRHVKRES